VRHGRPSSIVAFLRCIAVLKSILPKISAPVFSLDTRCPKWWGCRGLKINFHANQCFENNDVLENVYTLLHSGTTVAEPCPGKALEEGERLGR
jgi:hypothetical protein